MVDVVTGVDVVVVGWAVVVEEVVEVVVLAVEVVVVASLVLDVLDGAVVERGESPLADSCVGALHADRASPPAAMATKTTVLKLLFIFPPVMTTLSLTEAKPGASAGW